MINRFDASLSVRLGLCLFSLLIFACSGEPQNASPEPNLIWSELPDLPEAVGGPIAGISNGALVVAGGANFTASMFEGGTKVYHEEIYVLEEGAEQWQKGFRLQEPLAYAATVDTDAGIVCIGGHNEQEVSSKVIRITWNPVSKSIEMDTLPNLPSPLTFGAAVLMRNTIYVAGGQSSLDAKAAMMNFWSLDLSSKTPSWQELGPWPGPARVLPGLAAQNSGEKMEIYLFSGAEIIQADSGKVPRRCLTDGYRYNPGEHDSLLRWQRISSLDKPVVAAPVISFGPSHILVFSGTDCELDDQFWTLKDDNPGIPPAIRSYHTITDTWIKIGEMPGGKGVVTSKALPWQKGVVIVSGEDRPAHRTPNVRHVRIESNIPAFGYLNYSVVGAYFLLLTFMGFYLAGREKTTDDFFLGGKRIPWWAAGLSIFGTQLSALTFMALPAKVYSTDWTYYVGAVGIVLITPLVISYFLPFFRRLNITTAYEYLELRFNLLIRLVGSFNFILLQIGRMAIVLYLPAMALSLVTGINMYVSILAMGILSTLYTVLGGIEAVIWTDVIQVIVLLGGAIISLVFVFSQIDMDTADLVGSAWDQRKFHMITWSSDYTTTAVWVVLFGNMVTSLVSYTTDQSVIQRYLTTPTEKQAAKALWTNALITPIAGLIFYALGTSLFLFYQSHPQLLKPELQTDAILPLFIVQQLPVGISGLVIAALFAAAMSTLDSGMNSISATVTTDFRRWFNDAHGDQVHLKLARWITVAAGLIATVSALLLATFSIQSVWDMIFILSGLVTGGLGGIFILGIFSQKANGHGALVGLISGAFVIVLVQQFTQIHFFLYTAIGLVVCVVVGYLASLFITPSRLVDLRGLTIYTMVEKTREKKHV
ncbi:MAG: sodium/solute symporter [Saprospiraceae bacterium]|nr:sodium/solute symporter [Saprospiraceae bacterium]